MKEAGELDGMTKLAGLLCAGPALVMIIRSGLPYPDNFLLTLVTTVVGGLLFAAPQIAMFCANYISANESTRIAAVWISGGSLVAYAIYAFTLNLSTSSTASLSLLFFQVLATGAAYLLLGLIVAIIRLAKR